MTTDNPPNSGTNAVLSTSELPQPKKIVGRRVVVKVQLPIMGADLALVYNEDRTILMQVPTGQVSMRFGRREKKAFFQAELMPDGLLEIGEKVPDQAW